MKWVLEEKIVQRFEVKTTHGCDNPELDLKYFSIWWD